MRWQSILPIEPVKGIYPDLTELSLEELYEMERKALERLEKLRSSEPPSKRKFECPHIVWFSSCQREINELRQIRDAIIEVKTHNLPGRL